MSRFMPCKGDFFYVEFKPRDQVIGGFLSDTVQVVKSQDHSYRGELFTCIGRDNHALVGKRDSVCAPRITFVHDDVNYYPVGPEVLEALGKSRAGEEA